MARYSGRTLDAYRHDLRSLFQWAADHGVPVLEATRAHLEMYRSSMEERGLAASTIDRRLSTACGYYRFAHIDGRIVSNPAQYVRRPTVHPSQRRGLDRGELGRFLFTAERFDHVHAALAVLLGLNGLRVGEACETNIEDMAIERGHTGSCASSARATNLPSYPLFREPHAPSTSPSANGPKGRSSCVRMGSDSTVAPLIGGYAPSASGQTWAQCTRTCSEPPSSWPPSTPAYLSVKFRSLPDTLIREPPRCTTGAARTSTSTPPM
ncbi:MAG TPA: site-specific integrase [Mycobacterium sp.]|nr:site-specific integrase [Mycobacterium sp.]